MNASLSREQIEYIQSFCGKTQMDYIKTEDECTNDELDDLNVDYEYLSDSSDKYWWRFIAENGKRVSKNIREEEYRWYNIAFAVYQIGNKFFERMEVSENRSEQQTFSDIIEHYISWSFEIAEVVPHERVIIEYR